MKRNLIPLYSYKLFFVTLVIAWIFSPSFNYSQITSVSGKITASTVGVQNVSVTFINESDTTKKYNVITDNEGNYSVHCCPK